MGMKGGLEDPDQMCNLLFSPVMRQRLPKIHDFGFLTQTLEGPRDSRATQHWGSMGCSSEQINAGKVCGWGRQIGVGSSSFSD